MNENMFTRERYKLIEDYLKKESRATVDELAKMLYVSPATVRRDLTEMEKMGQIKRTHGGAIYNDSGDELNIFVRIENNAKEKDETAQIALKHLPSFNTVFVDNSSTCLALLSKMDLNHKTIVTNGFQLAVMLEKKKGVKVLSLGGQILYSSFSTAGSFATSMMNDFHFDLFLSSCAGLEKDGSYEQTLETMELKKLASSRSDKKLLLIDKTKFGHAYLYHTNSLSDYDLIITNAEDNVIKEYVSGENIHFINH